MKQFAVLVEPWGVYVKSWTFFIRQGGATQEWGRNWVRISAKDIASARAKGERRRKRLKAGAHS